MQGHCWQEEIKRTAQKEPTPIEQKVEYATNEIESKIRKTFPEHPDVMVAVAKAESELDPKRHNWGDKHKTCTGSFGIFQIGCIHGVTHEEMEDVDANLKMARHIYDTQGIEAWGAYTDGRYRQYLQ